MVAIEIAQEIHDIYLCELAMGVPPPDNERRLSRKSRAYSHHASHQAVLEKRMLGCFLLFRRYVLMPLVAICVPWVVMYRGADSLSICFNTLAILVCLSLDKYAYDSALPEATKGDFEEHGRVELTDTNLWTLKWIKAADIVTLLVTLVVSIPYSNRFAMPGAVSMFFIYFWSFVAGIIEGLVFVLSNDPTASFGAKAWSFAVRFLSALVATGFGFIVLAVILAFGTILRSYLILA